MAPARRMLSVATPDDAAGVADLRVAAAAGLTRRFGRGPWSRAGTVRGVLLDMRRATVFVVRRRRGVVATLTLGTRRPWAIDPRHFTPAGRTLYLTSMAVAPELQGQGLGRRCLEDVRRTALRWPADSIRLDAFDAPAGAGGFYETCGFREVARVRYRGVALTYHECLVAPPASGGPPRRRA